MNANNAVIPEIVTPPIYNFKELFCLKNPYSRQRYWAVLLLSFLANIVLGGVIGGVAAFIPPVFFVVIVFSVACCWIMFATMIKRLRDADVSLWWILLHFVPFVNFVVIITFGCIGSSDTKNEASARGVVITMILLGLLVVILPLALMASLGFAVIKKTHARLEHAEAAYTVQEVSGTVVSGTVVAEVSGSKPVLVTPTEVPMKK